MLRFLLQTHILFFAYLSIATTVVAVVVTFEELVPIDPPEFGQISDVVDKWLIGFSLSEAITSS